MEEKNINLKTIIENHFIDDWYSKQLFNTTLDKIKTHKLSCFHNILSNVFLNEMKKEEITLLFYNIQNLYIVYIDYNIYGNGNVQMYIIQRIYL